jgi:hypothetical protein
MAKIRTRTRNANALLAASMLLMVLCSVKAQGVPVGSQNQAQPKPVFSAPLVIQGRIATIRGALVTVKTPGAYTGGPGIHAQFVIGGIPSRLMSLVAESCCPMGGGLTRCHSRSAIVY